MCLEMYSRASSVTLRAHLVCLAISRSNKHVIYLYYINQWACVFFITRCFSAGIRGLCFVPPPMYDWSSQTIFGSKILFQPSIFFHLHKIWLSYWRGLTDRILAFLSWLDLLLQTPLSLFLSSLQYPIWETHLNYQKQRVVFDYWLRWAQFVTIAIICHILCWCVSYTSTLLLQKEHHKEHTLWSSKCVSRLSPRETWWRFPNVTQSQLVTFFLTLSVHTGLWPTVASQHNTLFVPYGTCKS